MRDIIDIVEGVGSELTARRWLNFLVKGNLDFDVGYLLDDLGYDPEQPSVCLPTVQKYLDSAIDKFDEIFNGRDIVIAYRGLPLAYKGRKNTPDGRLSHEDDYDTKFDFNAWMNKPLDPRTGGVGVSWTWDEIAAINFEQSRGPTNTVLKAEISASSVDWFYSFGILFNDPEEKEIRLRPRSKVKLLAVRRFDYYQRHDNHEDNYIDGWIDLGGLWVRA